MLSDIKKEEKEQKIDLVVSEYEAYKKWGFAAGIPSEKPYPKPFTETENQITKTEKEEELVLK